MNFFLLVLSFAQCITGLPETALMSWYGDPFDGRLTACGEVYDMDEISVAHKTLPMGTYVTFFYEKRAVRAIVNDRGPYIEGREFDASRALFDSLVGSTDPGVINIMYIVGERHVRDTMKYNL